MQPQWKEREQHGREIRAIGDERQQLGKETNTGGGRQPLKDGNNWRREITTVAEENLKEK